MNVVTKKYAKFGSYLFLIPYSFLPSKHWQIKIGTRSIKVEVLKIIFWNFEGHESLGRKVNFLFTFFECLNCDLQHILNNID